MRSASSCVGGFADFDMASKKELVDKREFVEDDVEVEFMEEMEALEWRRRVWAIWLDSADDVGKPTLFIRFQTMRCKEAALVAEQPKSNFFKKGRGFLILKGIQYPTHKV